MVTENEEDSIGETDNLNTITNPTTKNGFEIHLLNVRFLHFFRQQKTHEVIHHTPMYNYSYRSFIVVYQIIIFSTLSGIAEQYFKEC